MKEVSGQTKSIRKLLSDKFSVDYYQREYRWENKHMDELIKDLEEKFSGQHHFGNERRDVEKYDGYFLGSIIISNGKDGKKFIIDGQQRLTSITLILIFLHNKLIDKEKDLITQIAPLIRSVKHGVKSFNIHVKDRMDCMKSLFEKGESPRENHQSESVKNIKDRYDDIRESVLNELDDQTLPYFADWLIEKVHFVEIAASSDVDAYIIFETMNDRGLALTPTEMLKSYLLAKIDERDRDRMKGLWQGRIEALNRLDKKEDANAIKAWLRAQHAKNIREKKRGDKPQDFDIIGTSFHRWVRDKKDVLHLNTSPDFIQFIEEDFDFYTRWYEHIHNATKVLTPKLEAIFYNANNNFTLQFPALLAPLKISDDEYEVHRKLRIVSSYLDIMIARRIWNSKSIAHNFMVYNIFQTIKKIRQKSSDELASILVEHLGKGESFVSNNFKLHSQNRNKIHYLLARMTDYIERMSTGESSHYAKYIGRSGRSGYQIEHIWANQFDDHKGEFEHQNDFYEYRNRIGGLLLLPKSFNASLGNKSYKEKRKQYRKYNLFAQSLHENAYENNPGFIKFIKQSGLNFQPHSEFKKADLDARQELVGELAKKIWSPDVIGDF